MNLVEWSSKVASNGKGIQSALNYELFDPLFARHMQYRPHTQTKGVALFQE